MLNYQNTLLYCSQQNQCLDIGLSKHDQTWGDCTSSTWPLKIGKRYGSVSNLVPLVNIKIAGKWMFIPLKMVLIGSDPYPYDKPLLKSFELDKPQMNQTGDDKPDKCSNAIFACCCFVPNTDPERSDTDAASHSFAVFIHTYIYIHVYVYAYVYVYVYAYAYAYVYVYVYVHVHVHVYVSVDVYVYVDVYIYMYTYICICIYINIYVYISYICIYIDIIYSNGSGF